MKKYLPIIIIFLLGIFIRFYHFQNNLALDGDMARDFMIGMHMVKFHEIPLIGHSASGLTPPFYYPPYYFYTIGMLSLFTYNPLFLLRILIIWQCLLIFSVFLLAANLFNKHIGYISALFIAVGQFFVARHTYLFSGQFSTPLFIFSIYFLSIYSKNPKLKFVFLSIFLLILGSTISYSSLIFLPLYFICLLFIRQKLTDYIYIFIFTGFLLCILFYPLINYFGFEVFLSVFSPKTNFIFNNYFLQMIDISKINLNNLFPNIQLLSLIIFLLCFSLFIKTKHKSFRPYIFITFFIIYPIILASAKTGWLVEHYFDSIMPLKIVLLTAIICSINVKNKYFMKLIKIMFLFIFFYSTTNGFQFLKWTGVNYIQSENTANNILKDVQIIKAKNNFGSVNFFNIYIIDGQDIWGSVLLWYFVELQGNLKLTKIVNYGISFEQIYNDDAIYLVCKHSDKYKDDNFCITSFINQFNNKYYKIKKVLNGSDQNTIYLLKNKNSFIKI